MKGVLAEFVGGPLDGELRVMADARPEWRFPANPHVSLSALVANPAAAPVMHDELVYRKAAPRTLNAPTGEPVVRYVLVGPWPRGA